MSSYTTIGRGPMADDHYTKIHNLILRGAIPTKYVGTYGYIASQDDGWTVSLTKAAKDLKVGRDFLLAALRAIERVGCMVRVQERGTDGKLGAATWFITDIPMQLRAAGVTDAKVIAASTQAAFEQWQKRRSRPLTANPTTVATSKDESFPRSGPKSDLPSTAEPTTADPTPKKNLVLEDFDFDQEELPSSSIGSSAPAASPAGQPGRTEEEEARTKGNPERASEQAAAAEAVVDALPSVGRSRVGAKLRATLVAGIAAKLADGWQPGDIADELTRDLDTARTTGVYAHRLADMPTAPPRRRSPATPRTSPQPDWCGTCDQKTRQRVTDDDRPYRCPDCHPMRVGQPQSATEDRNPATVIPRQDARLSTLLGAAAGSVRV